MAFTSGSAATTSVLLNALNTFLLANGWTKIRGDIDLNVASPKAARYWRVVVHETVGTNSNTRSLRKLNLRTTVGGANVATIAANFTIDNLASGTAANLIAGSADVVTSNIGGLRSWKIQYDFGSPTIVREVEMQSTTSTTLSPRAFIIQWSNDNETWTTMFEATGLSWTSSEVKLFAFPDTYRFNEHPADNQPSRAGSAEDYPTETNFEGSPWRQFGEEYFIWQGPGYDASRRVYIHARGHRNPGNLTSHLEFQYSTGYDSAIRGFGQQVGSGGTSVFHIFTSNSVNYWFYINDLRLIIVTQSNVSDYTSSYIGFMEAFGHPDFYPFPLCMIASSPNRNQFVGTTENGLSSIVDPGYGALRVKKLDGLDYIGGNRVFGASEEAIMDGSSSPIGFPVVWPLHHGGTYSNAAWPLNKGSGTSNLAVNRRLFDFLLPTQQNDLPMLPAMVMDRISGNLGILSGVYAIPGGGLLAPQQAIVISGVTYRVFPNRSRRNGSSWFAVKEA
jgi:hypothetical protein